MCICLQSCADNLKCREFSEAEAARLVRSLLETVFKNRPNKRTLLLLHAQTGGTHGRCCPPAGLPMRIGECVRGCAHELLLSVPSRGYDGVGRIKLSSTSSISSACSTCSSCSRSS
jgi:hypothetical protein